MLLPQVRDFYVYALTGHFGPSLLSLYAKSKVDRLDRSRIFDVPTIWLLKGNAIYLWFCDKCTIRRTSIK